MRLPAQTPEETKRSCVTNAIQTWLSVGYRPALVSKAFDGIVASFATAFPGTFFTLPIILTNGFPPIGDAGVAIPRGQARASNAQLLDALLRSAATRLPNRLILQQDFLVADQPARARTIELSAANGLPVAWQTNLFFGGDAKGAGYGGRIGTARPCDNASYLRLLQNGIAPEGGHGPNARARYIEVFPFDALAFPAAVESAHRALVE